MIGSPCNHPWIDFLTIRCLTTSSFQGLWRIFWTLPRHWLKVICQGLELGSLNGTHIGRIIQLDTNWMVILSDFAQKKSILWGWKSLVTPGWGWGWDVHMPKHSGIWNPGSLSPRRAILVYQRVHHFCSWHLIKPPFGISILCRSKQVTTFIHNWVVKPQIFCLFSPRKLGKMKPFWLSHMFQGGLVQPPTRKNYKS